MEEDDDAWSYSFPPSTDLLPLEENGNNDVTSQSSTNGSKNGLKKELAQPKPRDPENMLLNTSSESTENNLRSVSVSLLGNTSQSLGNTSSGGFMPKAVPADPHTTKKDASSIISKEGSTNALAQAPSVSSSPPLTPRTDFSNSIRIWQKQQEQDSQTAQLTEMAAAAAAESLNADVAVSPKIIAYRKHKKTLSESLGPAFVEQQNEIERDKFDPKLYVAEKFKDTPYRYATMKRNVDFHQLFRSLDLTDRLLDDFSCALSREILLQGRVYVTEHSICFNSNLLGWVTSLVIPFEQIKRIDKKTTAGLFPNGISIETPDAKHNFASFISRDSTYDFLRAVWHASTGKDYSELNSSPPLSPTAASITLATSAEGKIANYINSIDGDDGSIVGGKSKDDLDGVLSSSEDSDESDDESDYSNSNVPLDSPNTAASVDAAVRDVNATATKIQRLNPDSSYKNMGPETHPPTQITKRFEDDEQEHEVCTATISAPMGTVFDILYGSNDTSFHSKFLETHDASEISKYDDYHPMEDDPTKLERKYVYKRALGYSIGPKSTRCIVSEVIEHLNFADYVVLLSITSTPDVPSGGAFTVRTRYYFTWGEANTTKVKIAYYVKWTGSSWIKKMVENLTQSAQAAAAKDLIEALNREISKHTFAATGPPALKADVEKTPEELQTLAESTEAKPKKGKTKTKKLQVAGGSVIGVLGLFGLLFVLLIAFQFKLVVELQQSRSLMETQLALTSNLLAAMQSQAHIRIPENANNEDFWKFVSEQEGRTLKGNERSLFLAKQALMLLKDDKATKGKAHGLL